jgi:hypothetical protein
MRRTRALLAGAALLLATGCPQQMANQPSFRPLEPTDFFADGTSARPPVPGTVARGFLYAGEDGAGGAVQSASVVALLGPGAPLVGPALASEVSAHAREFPFPVTRKVLERGQIHFNVFCSVCHDAAGTGTGMVVRRGFTRPPSLHEPRLRQAPPGYFFHVITNGYGAMPDYASPIPPRDRWAVAAYVRALQRSQAATLEDMPPDVRGRLLRERGAK